MGLLIPAPSSRIWTQAQHRRSAPCLAAVAAFRALGVRRIALIHPPWFADDENQLGIAYFRSQGFDVVYANQMRLRGLRAFLDEMQLGHSGIASLITEHGKNREVAQNSPLFELEFQSSRKLSAGHKLPGSAGEWRYGTLLSQLPRENRRVPEPRKHTRD